MSEDKDDLLSGMDEEARVKRAALPELDEASLLVLAKDPSSNVRRAVSRQKKLPKSVLAVLAVDDSSWSIRHRAAYDPETPSESLVLIAKGKDTTCVAAAARNPSLPASALVELSTHPDMYVRASVASNINTPSATLEAMSDGEVEVLWEIAGNLAATRATITKISARSGSTFWEHIGGNETVERYLDERLATHPATPPALIEKIATSRDSYYRFLCCQNPMISKALLRKLSKDKDDGVRERAEQHPLSLQDKFTDERLAAAQDPDTPPEKLAELARTSEVALCFAVAQNPGTPAEVLKEMLQQRNTPELQSMLLYRRYQLH
jgi:hypothetical protein